MAYLKDKVLFFTTSPRTPLKMLPEIKILQKYFEGYEWNSKTQIEFIEKLANSTDFMGIGSTKDKAFSARDRINRAPKSLGFVDLSPVIKITQSGIDFINNINQEEIFLRQLLKFQLPSPYHIEKADIDGSFCVKPYLEIFRLIRTLDYLTFDELKIFGMQLIHYNLFENIVNQIKRFRIIKEKNKGIYKKIVDEELTKMIYKTYSSYFNDQEFKTRESNDKSMKKFLSTKKSNLRDYTDACFRYLRATGLVSISHKNYSITINKNRLEEVDFFLSNVDRVAKKCSLDEYKKNLFSNSTPILLTDNKNNLINSILKISSYTYNDLLIMDVNKLKKLKIEIIEKNRENTLIAKIKELKSYSLYSEIIDTFNEIVSDEIYDAPLMLEWNTWRALTMLNGGVIKGNFKLDDNGEPMSTAPGNMPDIVCAYDDFNLAVEVTLQSGQRQYESEGESVARHYGKLKTSSKKDTYCLFIAPTISQSTLAHFYGLNKIDISFYGGKSQIIPLELDRFMKLVENSYSFDGVPTSNHVKSFLLSALNSINVSNNENDWMIHIYHCVDNWLSS